jgi:hypothetical protein
MAQSTPFQVVTGVAVVPQAPFGSLYQHVKQRDPKLSETLDKLSQPANVQPNLTNPLQILTFGLGNPSTGDTTPRAQVLSNVPTDQTMYFPLCLYGNVAASSSTDIELDILVSHNNGVNYITLLTSNFIIPAGDLVPATEIITFAEGAYLRNLDLVYMEFLSSAFDGQSINVSLMFQ